MRWLTIVAPGFALISCLSCTSTMGAYDAQSQVSTIQTRLADPALSPHEFCQLVNQLEGLNEWIKGKTFPIVPVRALKDQLRGAMQSAFARYHGGMKARIETGEGLPGWRAPAWLATGTLPV